MSENSKIEWLGWPGYEPATWNCTLGCDKISPGCKLCFAMSQVWRMAHNPNPKIAEANAGLVVMTAAGLNWTGKINAIEDRLTIPLRKKKPTCYFVNSLSDLFHEDIYLEFVAEVFAVMALTPRHRYIVLTKRSKRMRDLVTSPDFREFAQISIDHYAMEFSDPLDRKTNDLRATAPDVVDGDYWPLPNVILGVSAENQKYADERIPDLIATPAVVRMVSHEPALGPIKYRPEWLRGMPLSGGAKVGWVIAGYESGHGARPAQEDWMRADRDQCLETMTPFFYKQSAVYGKKQSLPHLDGQQWIQFPTL